MSSQLGLHQALAAAEVREYVADILINKCDVPNIEANGILSSWRYGPAVRLRISR